MSTSGNQTACASIAAALAQMDQAKARTEQGVADIATQRAATEAQHDAAAAQIASSRASANAQYDAAVTQMQDSIVLIDQQRALFAGMLDLYECS